MARRTGNYYDEVTLAPREGAELYVWLRTANGEKTDDLASLTDDLGAPIPNPIILGSSGDYVLNTADGVYYAEVWQGSRREEVIESFVVGSFDLAVQDASVAAALADRPTFSALVDPGGADLSGFSQASSYSAGTAGARLKQSVSVKDPPYNALGNGVANDTAAIQAAIDSNARDIYFPAGTYVHGALTCDNEYQRFIGWGAVLQRNNAGVTAALSARGVQHIGTRFDGGGLAGNNITINNPDCVLAFCESRGTTGVPVLAQNNAGGLFVLGGVYQVTDGGGTKYEFELRDTTPGTSLYQVLLGFQTNQGAGNEGGVLGDGPGTIRIGFSQFGKLRMQNGSGGMFVGNRVNGDAYLLSSTSSFSCTAFAGDVYFGDGSSPNIGQFGWDPSNIVASGGTLTIDTEVVESSFHLGLSEDAGATIVINNYNNNIWHKARTYTPTVAVEGGGFVIGSGGTIQGWHVCAGRQHRIFVRIVMGSTGFNMGSGDLYVTLPNDPGYSTPGPMKAGFFAQGTARIVDAGTRPYTGICFIDYADSAKRNRVYVQPEGATTNVRVGVPHTWAAGDIIELQITYEWGPE